MSKDSRLVYSTDQGRIKTLKADPVSTPNSDGIVRIHRESKGRGGKIVTLITGVPLPAPQLKELAKKLKQHCGTGGAIKDGIIEIQGDHREKIKAFLGQTYSVKLAGG